MPEPLVIRSLMIPKMTRTQAYEFVEKLLREAQKTAESIEDRRHCSQLQQLLMYFAPAVPAVAKTKMQYLARFVAGPKELREQLKYIAVQNGVAYATDGTAAAKAAVDLADGYYEPKTGAILEPESANGLNFPFDGMRTIFNSAKEQSYPDDTKVYEGMGKSETTFLNKLYRFSPFHPEFGYNCAYLDIIANKQPIHIANTRVPANAAVVTGDGVLADDVVIMPLKM